MARKKAPSRHSKQQPESAQRLDLQLRHSEPGQILHRVRQAQAQRGTPVPLRQVRLGAGRSKASPEVLPGMRRPL